MMDIEILELSARTYNCLKRRSINTVEHLMSIPDEDLEHIFAIGVNGLAEVKEKLKTRYTNADHIRSMSDEELADLLYNFGMSNIVERGKTEIARRADKYHIELWLRTPYKEKEE